MLTEQQHQAQKSNTTAQTSKSSSKQVYQISIYTKNVHACSHAMFKQKNYKKNNHNKTASVHTISSIVNEISN